MKVLAFDDGPLETTARNLDTLRAHGRSAIFFVVGERIEGREPLLRRMVDEGHEVGNHTMTHRRLTELAPAELWQEIGRCGDAIKAATGITPTAFRPPFCARNDRVDDAVAGLGYTRVYLESSLGDYALEPAEIVAVADGADFVGLHDGITATVAALPAILEACA